MYTLYYTCVIFNFLVKHDFYLKTIVKLQPCEQGDDSIVLSAIEE